MKVVDSLSGNVTVLITTDILQFTEKIKQAQAKNIDIVSVHWLYMSAYFGVKLDKKLFTPLKKSDYPGSDRYIRDINKKIFESYFFDSAFKIEYTDYFKTQEEIHKEKKEREKERI